MIVTEDGRQITLNDNNFIAAGGEGSVYKHNSKVYKIYQNKLQFDLESKISELSVLSNKYILKPLHPLYSNSKVVGYSMKFAQDADSLSKLFTNSYRDRHSISNDTIVQLIDNFISIVKDVHKKNILIVDMNEFNFLVDKLTHTKVYAIDVDSWQTSNFPATAILPTIQDFHTKGFSKLTDWYSFAIIAFQLFTGIHPFKGKYNKDPRMKITDRMKGNISLFNKEVNLPNNARSLDNIPINLRNWMKTLFEGSTRSEVPKDWNSVIQTVVQVVSNIATTLLKTFIEDINALRIEILNGVPAYYTPYGLYYQGTVFKEIKVSDEVILIDNKLHILCIKDNKIQLCDMNRNVILSSSIEASDIQIIGEQIIAVSRGDNNYLTRISITKIGNKYLLSQSGQYTLLPSFVMYKNTVYVDMIGKAVFYIPYNGNSMSLLKIPELDGLRIVDAKVEKRFMQVITYDKGSYDMYLVRLSADYRTYKIVKHDGIDPTETNFTVLDNGIVVILYNGDKLIVTSTTKEDEKEIQDPGIVNSKLFSTDRIHVAQNGKIYKISMK